MFAIALPLLQQAILFVLWFIPMRPKIHATVFHLIEIVHAWAALEVCRLSSFSSYASAFMMYRWPQLLTLHIPVNYTKLNYIYGICTLYYHIA